MVVLSLFFEIVACLPDPTKADSFQLLSDCSVESVTRLFLDNDVRNYCILVSLSLSKHSLPIPLLPLSFSTYVSFFVLCLFSSEIMPFFVIWNYFLSMYHNLPYGSQLKCFFFYLFLRKPPLISFKRDKNIGNFLVRSVLKSDDQPGTFICARKRCSTCPFITVRELYLISY